jgi:hypothetical protein
MGEPPDWFDNHVAADTVQSVGGVSNSVLADDYNYKHDF